MALYREGENDLGKCIVQFDDGRVETCITVYVSKCCVVKISLRVLPIKTTSKVDQCSKSECLGCGKHDFLTIP